MQKLYLRCNGGDYFHAEPDRGCPFDGWGEKWIGPLCKTFAALCRENGVVTVDMLRARGVPLNALARVLIIEFGTPTSSFEALTPAYYHHNGALRNLDAGDVPKEFL